jgi:hypothetical protein
MLVTHQNQLDHAGQTSMDQRGPAWTSVKCMLVYAVVFRRDQLDVSLEYGTKTGNF